MIKNHKIYDALKFLALVGLPAFATFWFALSQIWGIPGAKEVVGTVVAVDAFLGACLQISTQKYNNSDAKFDGTMQVMPTPNGGKTFSLELNGEPEQLADMDQVVFKVDKSDKVAVNEQEWMKRH